MENDGGPAFPKLIRKIEKYMDEGGYGRKRIITLNEGGMSLRDYFAGQALAGMLGDSLCNPSPEKVATDCYRQADAMLKEREQEKGE